MTTKLTKVKVIAAILLGAILLCCLIAAAAEVKKDGIPSVPSPDSVSTNEERIGYLAAWGWEVDPSAVETLDLLLPEPLEESYLSYNDLQSEHGLDLTPYSGERVKRYTYTVLNHPTCPDAVQANLYLCGDTVIAGDIMSVGPDGFIASLHFPK